MLQLAPMSEASERIQGIVGNWPIDATKALESIADAARLQDLDSLMLIARLSRMSSMHDEILAEPSIFAMLKWEDRGIAELADIVSTGFYGDLAQCLLTAVSAGVDLRQCMPTTCPPDWLEQCGIAMTVDTSTSATRALRELILRQDSDKRLRRRLLRQADGLGHGALQGVLGDYFVDMLFEARLSVNSDIIAAFEARLNSATREEDIHSFMAAKPVLLDPLALELRNKHELGAEFVTDFVLRRYDGEYVLVELEKTTDRLFTSSGRIHSQLTDALSQVRDFQSWIHDNIAYARNKLPGIRRPLGMVVIGRNSQLAAGDRVRLDEENYSRRGHARIVTYDDLVDQARTVYQNVLNRPPQSRVTPIPGSPVA
jgi:hypothetical protein